MPDLKLPGTYRAEVTDAALGTAKTGTDFVLLKLRTDEHEMCDAYLYLSEKAFDRTVKTLHEVFGFDGVFGSLPEQLCGRRCRLEAEEETDEKSMVRVRVKWINPEHSPVADASFVARLSARAAQLLAGKATVPPSPTSPPAKPRAIKKADGVPEYVAEADECDLPF
jgi:hypothetical protein